MDTKNLAGSLKAAILVQAMGQGRSKEILNGLSEEEREVISSHLSKMGTMPVDLAEKVAREFVEIASKPPTRQIKGDIISGKELSQKIETGDSTPGSANLQALQSLEVDHLAELIKDEHPQTIAIIIAHLKSDKASEVLSLMPEGMRTDIILRISELDKVISGMVEEIDKVFEDVLKNEKTTGTHKTGGVSQVAEILNQVDSISAELILSEIEEDNPELAAQIKQKMFVFEDLILVDDKGLQKLLRSVESKELAIALKAASEEVRQKILRNMSERAGEMLGEEIESLGAVRMKEVEDAQQKITRIIQDMEAKGEIVISGRKGEQLIV